MWLWFVEKGWLYCMLIMGVVLTVQLIIHWKDWTFLRKMGAFTVIVLVFHVMEEWVMPGGFHNFGASSQVQPGHLGLKKGGSCSLCPCQHGVCQVLSGCSGDARVVFHPGGDRHLPARRGRLHQEGGQPLPSAVERGAAAARSCSNYNEFVVHWAPSFDEGSMPGF